MCLYLSQDAVPILPEDVPMTKGDHMTHERRGVVFSDGGSETGSEGDVESESSDEEEEPSHPTPKTKRKRCSNPGKEGEWRRAWGAAN